MNYEPDFEIGTHSIFARAIAAEVRAMSAASRISGKQLAMAIGLSQNYLAKRLRDEAPLTLDDIDAIGQWFDLPAGDIIKNAADREDLFHGPSIDDHRRRQALSASMPNLQAVADETQLDEELGAFEQETP